MGDTGSDPANTKVVVGKDAPWWVAAAFKFIAVLGIPGVVLSFYMYKDYKFEERRLEVERQRNATQEKTNVLLERFEKVLWRVERRVGSEDGGGK